MGVKADGDIDPGDKSGMTQLMGMLAQMKLDPIDRVALEAMAAGMR